MKNISKDFYFKLQRIQKLGGPVRQFIYEGKRVFVFGGEIEGIRYDTNLIEGLEVYQTDFKALLSALSTSAQHKFLWYPEYDAVMLSDPERWVDLFISAQEKRLRFFNPLRRSEPPIFQIMPREINGGVVFDYTVVFGETWFQGAVIGDPDIAYKVARQDFTNFLHELQFLR